MRLIAHFDVNLPGSCLINWPENELILFNSYIENFEITIELIKDSSIRSKGVDDKFWTYVLDSAKVKVARDEVEAPPKVIPNNNGQLDYTVQSEYFSSRIIEYGSIACESINRMFNFFKYKFNTPFIQDIPCGHQSFKNAKWTDSSGKVVGKGSPNFVVGEVYGLRGQLNVQKLTPENALYLKDALANRIEPLLHEEILSDAQTALFEKKLRRAILELAIACEIFVKRSFFSSDTPEGAAFDYLEDKSRFRVTVPELINRIAREAFDKSFLDDFPEDYKNIDHLFRCRNKVAHRGELYFRNDSGEKQKVDYELAITWWESVMQLISWFS